MLRHGPRHESGGAPPQQEHQRSDVPLSGSVDATGRKHLNQNVKSLVRNYALLIVVALAFFDACVVGFVEAAPRGPFAAQRP